MTGTRPLTLKRDEVMVCIDRVMNVEPMQPEEMRAIPQRLIVKLAALYLEMVYPQQTNPNQEATIEVTEAEAWLLRTKTNSGEKMTSDAFFGMNLLRKIYRVLLEFDADTDSLPLAEEEGPAMGAWQKDALKLWQQKEDDDEKQTA